MITIQKAVIAWAKMCETDLDRETRSIAIPPASASALASASACKMLGQMVKSWNLSLSVFFLAFYVCLS